MTVEVYLYTNENDYQLACHSYWPNKTRRWWMYTDCGTIKSW